MIILIDNGHGENTAGKRSPDERLREYSYARIVADSVVYELKKRSINATRLVRETVDVSLAERVRRVNEECTRCGASNVLLISIHCNASGNGEWMKARGWSAYTSPGATKSDKVATCLYEVAEEILQGQIIRKDMSDGDPDWEANFYMLTKTKCAAVLTENMFMDNREDCEFLLSEAGCKAIVDVHVKGILKYLGQ